ncbi:MAG: TonB-dependent receptor plug domain-containing protein, partial [Chitinophagaceae bacterium]
MKSEKQKMLKNTLPIGHLYGKLIDQKTQKPIPFASVRLISIKGSSDKKDTIIGGCFTEKNGDFNIDNINVVTPYMMETMRSRKNSNLKDSPSLSVISKIPFPEYKLQIATPGYEDYELPISFSSHASNKIEIPISNIEGDNLSKPNKESMRSSIIGLFNNLDKDLGNIAIQPKQISSDLKKITLGEITVTSNKSKVELSIDKRSYHVSNMPLAENGTAVDIMKNIPALNVDINGNVSLRNSTPEIYIDGQPTDLTLDMIPSEMIEKVEVISNPSAKYEAGTSTGILNIITKKNNRVGYFGMARLGIDRFG